MWFAANHLQTQIQATHLQADQHEEKISPYCIAKTVVRTVRRFSQVYSLQVASLHFSQRGVHQRVAENDKIVLMGLAMQEFWVPIDAKICSLKLLETCSQHQNFGVEHHPPSSLTSSLAQIVNGVASGKGRAPVRPGKCS